MPRPIQSYINISITPKARNATYISPKSQNDVINVIGYDNILSDIVDEVSCHNFEHLPICICFVDSEFNIREDFITFIKLGRVRAVDNSDAIIQSLENIGLSLSNLHDQEYDGASTMSGARAGIQARIGEKQPKAIYTHFV